MANAKANAEESFMAGIRKGTVGSPSPSQISATDDGLRAARVQKILKECNTVNPTKKAKPSQGNADQYRRSLNVPLNSRKARSEMEARTGVRGVSWKQILQGIAGILAILFAGYWATHDTPENRATNERALFQVDIARLEAEKSKAWAAVELAKVEKMPPSAVVSLVASNNSFRTDYISPGSRWVLSRDTRYVVAGGGSVSSPAAMLFFSGVPKNITGEYLLVYKKDPTKRTWSRGWSTDSPPFELEGLLKDRIQGAGKNEAFDIYTKGGQIEILM